MTRTHRRSLDAAVLIVIALGVVVSTRCAGPGSSDAGAGIDAVQVRAVLEHLAENVVLATHERFATAAATLEGAADTYASTFADADRVAARDAWIEAMDLWQRLEMMQLGPAAVTTRPGGRALRDEIDSWPLTNECRIDQEIVEGVFTDRDAFAMELVNVRGLDAMEYLLFYDGTDNACSPLGAINEEGTWAALGPDEIAGRRAAYAATLAYLVRVQADALADAWRPAGEDFAGALARADAPPYPDPGVALNAVSDGLFYLDLVTKDQKLTVTLPEEVESPHALRSREHALANVEAFQEIMLGAPPGTDAPGFDDLLRQVGEDELADRMEASLAGAVSALEAIGEPLATAVVSQPAAVVAAREAVRLITDDLKGRFVTALFLRIPVEAGGDAD